jgi:lipopolysaccharide export system protein LptA
MRPAVSLALALALAAVPLARVLASPASARDAGDLEIQVDGPLEVDLQQRTGVGRGHVWLRQGPVRVCCGRLELAYGERGVEAATCTEDVVVVTDPQRLEPVAERAPRASAPTPPEVWATAERARYADGRVTLEGGVRLWTLGGRLTGERFTYVIAGRRARLVGAPSRWVPTDAPPDLPRPCPASP